MSSNCPNAIQILIYFEKYTVNSQVTYKVHNIIQIHNIVPCDQQYSTKYSIIQAEYEVHSAKYCYVPLNTVMDLNNVM